MTASNAGVLRGADGYHLWPQADISESRWQTDDNAMARKGQIAKLVGLTVVLQKRYEVLIEVIVGPVTW
jgi:hypothetical protein